jgi:YD repeat-containing protein
MKQRRLGIGWRIVTWIVLLSTTAWSVNAQQFLDVAKDSGASVPANKSQARLVDVDSESGQPSVTGRDGVLFRGLEILSVSRGYRHGLKAQGLGPGWQLSCDERVVVAGDGSARIQGAQGDILFKARPDGSWETASGQLLVLRKTADGYRLDLPGLSVREYSKEGLLLKWLYPQGGFTVERGSDGLAKAVADRGGKRLVLNSEQGRYTSMQDPAGSLWKYSYDAKGRLAEVARPAGLRETFAYDDADRLVSVDQGFGKLALRYDDKGRVTEQASADNSMLERRIYSETAGLLEVRTETSAGPGFSIRKSADGRTLEYTAETGSQTVAKLDPRGQLLSVQADGKDVLSATSDEKGYYKTLTMAGVTFALEYADDGKVTGLKFPGKDVRQEFDAGGRPTLIGEKGGGSAAMQWKPASARPPRSRTRRDPSPCSRPPMTPRATRRRSRWRRRPAPSNAMRWAGSPPWKRAERKPPSPTTRRAA